MTLERTRVVSIVRLEMAEGCNGAFKLEYADVRKVRDQGEFIMSCYGEICGDYNRMLGLVIQDSRLFTGLNIQ
jgi:hypothetical protein